MAGMYDDENDLKYATGTPLSVGVGYQAQPVPAGYPSAPAVPQYQPPPATGPSSIGKVTDMYSTGAPPTGSGWFVDSGPPAAAPSPQPMAAPQQTYQFAIPPSPYTGGPNAPGTGVTKIDAPGTQPGLPPGYAPPPKMAAHHTPGMHLLDWDGNHMEDTNTYGAPPPASGKPMPAKPAPAPVNKPAPAMSPSSAYAAKGFYPSDAQSFYNYVAPTYGKPVPPEEDYFDADFSGGSMPSIGAGYSLGGSEEELGKAASEKAKTKKTASTKKPEAKGKK